jgi:hypothetical protein
MKPPAGFVNPLGAFIGVNIQLAAAPQRMKIHFGGQRSAVGGRIYKGERCLGLGE